MFKRLRNKLAFPAIISVLILFFSACSGGGTPGATTSPGGATPTHTPTHTATPKPTETPASSPVKYSMGQSIPFGGATFVITSARKTNEITTTLFGETTTYTPKNGMYVIVYFTFKGNANNEHIGVDAEILRLEDSKGNVYLFTADLNNHETNDLALAELHGLNLLSMCMWHQTEVKSLLQVFDVNAGATGIKLDFVDHTGKALAQVDLGL